MLGNTSSCESPAVDAGQVKPEAKGYGMRLPHEIKHDERIANDSFFTEAEKADLKILADIVCPGDPAEEMPSASDVDVVDFMEFMALDQPDNFQTKMRGGLAWLNSEAAHRFPGRYFIDLTPDERIQIVDDIAYPEEAEGTPMAYGAKFFDTVRFLTLTGVFTSKEGVAYLGYQGNAANVWDGVPQEVLDAYGLEYDASIAYVDQRKRDVLAEWDEEGRLIS